MEKEKEYKFTYAWCEKEQDLLTPLDVRDIWRQGDIEPLLQCPDEQCRKDNPGSRIIPVCCNPDAPCKKMQPYFRTGPEHPHSDGCGYAELAEATEYVMNHKARYRGSKANNNLLRDLKGIDTSLLADEYLIKYDPREELRAIEAEARRRISRKVNRQESLCLARSVIRQKTGSLTRVVEMCEKLVKIGKQGEVPLILPGRADTTTYQGAFFALPALRADYDTVYIFYGMANVEKNHNGYVVKYRSPLRIYRPDLPAIHAVTLIDEKACRKSLLKTLELYASTKEICCVYTFSTHSLNESTSPASEVSSCVVITPKASDAVVIRKECVKHR